LAPETSMLSHREKGRRAQFDCIPRLHEASTRCEDRASVKRCVYRELEGREAVLLGAIDRSEQIDAIYRRVDGVLQLETASQTVARWQGAELQAYVRRLDALLSRGVRVRDAQQRYGRCLPAPRSRAARAARSRAVRRGTGRYPPLPAPRLITERSRGALGSRHAGPQPTASSRSDNVRENASAPPAPRTSSVTASRATSTRTIPKLSAA